MGIAGIKSLLHSSHIFLVLNTKTNSRQKYSSPSHIPSLYFDLKFPLYLSREHLEQSHRKQIRKYITTPRECYHKKGGWAWAGCVCKCQQCWLSTFSFLVCDSTPKMCAGLLLLRVWFQLCKRDRNTIFFISEVSRRVSWSDKFDRSLTCVHKSWAHLSPDVW